MLYLPLVFCLDHRRRILPDDTFVATTYGHWKAGEEPYILSVRFKLSELDEMANE